MHTTPPPSINTRLVSQGFLDRTVDDRVRSSCARRTRDLFAALASMLVAGCLASLQGCNIAAAAFYVVHGPDQKIPKQFDLPAERPTVIFIDDRNNRLPSRDLREMIADAAGQTLLSEGAVKDLIDHRGALGVASKDRFGEPMTISEIGRAVSAEVVIYVAVDTYSISPDGQTIAPTTSMSVKVIDAVSEQRLWPTDKPAYGLSIQSPPRQGTATSSAADLFKVRQDAAARAGLGVAQLFSEHLARESATKGSPSTR